MTLKVPDRQLRVRFADNGRGLEVGAVREKNRTEVRPHQVEERVGLLGGQIEIAFSDGDGTTIMLRLPKSPRIGD